MLFLNFRYWRVEIIAEGEEPIGKYDELDDDSKPDSVSLLATALENNTQQD